MDVVLKMRLGMMLLIGLIELGKELWYSRFTPTKEWERESFEERVRERQREIQENNILCPIRNHKQNKWEIIYVSLFSIMPQKKLVTVQKEVK